MKKSNHLSPGYRAPGSHSFAILLIFPVLLITSCTGRTVPYSILEFTGTEEIANYSKSMYLASYYSDSVNSTSVICSRGDLFLFKDLPFIYEGRSAQNRFSVKTIDYVQYVNGKIYSIFIPDNDDMITWFKNIKDKDLSSLQFLEFSSKPRESYLPYLSALAKIKPDAGLFYVGSLKEMAGFFKIFNPRFIIGSSLSQDDYDQLSKLTNLRDLLITLDDSVITDPLPSMPELKQLIIDENRNILSLTNSYLINNRQIEKLTFNKAGSLDLSILKPLDHLKELVANVPDTIINPDIIHKIKNIEVLSIKSLNSDYTDLPLLRWITFPSNIKQEEFNTFVDAHPDLEVIEIIKNSKISNLQSLSKLRKLYGLTIIDTVTDIASIKTLKNLRYLSLPDRFLEDRAIKDEIQKSLPSASIAANEGFCLGSGWLLLIIPLVLIFKALRWHPRVVVRN